MDASSPYDSVSDLFPALCNIAGFIVNCREMFSINEKLTPAGVSVLTSLLTSGAGIECLHIDEELPAGAGAKLGEAIKCSGRISELSLNYFGEKGKLASELIRLIAASASPALEQLIIMRMEIDDQHMIQLCNSFGKFTTLRSLAMRYFTFNLTLLAERISELQALESLEIYTDGFISSGGNMLVAAIKQLPVMTNLTLIGVKIEVEGLQHIGVLIASGRIVKLKLNSNELNNEGISIIVDNIFASGRQTYKLQEISLYGNGIGPAGTKKVLELVARSPHLRCLDLGLNPLVEIPAETLKNCASSIEELIVNDNKIGPRAIVLLLASLTYPALTLISAKYSGIGNLGAGAIARFLLDYGGRTLRELELGSNGITDSGALKLANGLANAYALQRIDIGSNPLGPPGAVAILDALATASTMAIDSINFMYCEIGDAGAEGVGKFIMRRDCKSMTLMACEIYSKGAKAIADSIDASAYIIETLNLVYNPLGDAGVKYFLDKITKQNRSVRELYIDKCDIGMEGAMAIKRAIEAQGALRKLTYFDSIKDKKAIDILNKAEKAKHGSKSE